ncbi:MAG: Xaa-Pro peptidase family protein [Candidatus Omnitrophica bacterium]|nr:Xaa-Pro peptidase family protein [Candidatus Omnitrophota bacterium]
MTQERIQRLREYLKTSNAGAYLVSLPANIRYLSGFTGMDCRLLITRRKNFFLGDFRYITQARQELDPSFEIQQVDHGFGTCLYRLLGKTKSAGLCFESKHTSVYAYNSLKNTLKGIRLLPVTDIIEQQRQVKTGTEISAIRTAAAITRKTLKAIQPLIRPGVTEYAVKNKLEELLCRFGSEKPAFDIIVASGPNAAMPHAQTTQRKIGKHDPVIIDIGAQWNGYKSDLTRTFFSGRITKYIEYYKLIGNAQHRAISLIKPGVNAAEIDAAARQILHTARVEKYFGHALGHGVGLEIHEGPSISGASRQQLCAGMVFTVEPGIYIPRDGGVRVEDMVVVTEKGCEIL